MNKTLVTKITLLALAVSLAACGKKESAGPAASSNEIVVKIGTANPLTGTQAHLGKDNENGIRMAIDEANAKGITIGGKKAKFVLLSEDDQADPRQATIIAQKMVDAKVNGVIGHLNSGTTIPASRIYHDAGIVQISPSATNITYTAQGFKTALRVMANDAQQGKALAEFATRHLNAKRIAIIDDRTAYGQGQADQFEQVAKANGAEIVGREFTSDKATDFMAVLTAIKAKKPELLFYGGMDTQSGPMMKQIKSLGLEVKFLTGDGGSTPQFIQLAGAAAAEGAYSSLPGVPLEKMPGGKAFADKFTAKYGQIQSYAPYAYDAANAMIAAMQKAGSAEPVKYLPELAKIEFDGVTAKIHFDEKGDIKAGFVTVYQVKEGKWGPVETLGGEAAK